jgi:hypothetical protein
LKPECADAALCELEGVALLEALDGEELLEDVVLTPLDL